MFIKNHIIMKQFIYLFLVLLISFSLKAQESDLQYNLRGHFTKITALAFSPDGKRLLTVASDAQKAYSEIKIWEVASGAELLSFQDNTYIADVAFSPDGRYFYTGGGLDAQRNFKVWNAQNASFLQHYRGQAAVSAIAISSDYLLAGGLDGKLSIWQGNNSNLPTQLAGHREHILDLSISTNGRYWVSCGGNFSKEVGEIILWDAQQKSLLKRFSPQSHVVNSVAISPDGEWLVSASEDGKLLVWEVSTGKILLDLSQRFGQFSKVAISPNGQFILAASNNSNLKLYRRLDGKLLHTFRGHFKGVNAIAFSPKGQHVASGGGDQVAKIWQAVPVGQLIAAQVEEGLRDWLKKGKFEKTSDYEARISDVELRQKEAQRLQQIAIKSLVGQKLSQNPNGDFKIDIQKTEYDADNEVFRLSLRQLEPILLKVPISEAKAFDLAATNQQIYFRNCDFGLSPNGNMALQKAELLLSAQQKAYLYEDKALLQFNQQNINYEIDLPNYAKNDFDKPNNYPNTNHNSNNNSNNPNKIRKVGISEVDYDLPKSKSQRPEAVAVVIGNAVYQKTKNVDFAIADARSVRNYLLDVLGFKRENIIYLENASYSDFKMVFGDKNNPKGKLYNLVKPNISEVFVFYSGHGAPGLNDKRAYFVPAECDPQYVELTGFPSDIFYNNLAKIPSKSSVVVLDACFSGENIYENISPIVIKSKGALGLKNGALLASSAPDQVSTWYNEKGHGLFTYFFLKAIHNRNADTNQDKQLTLEEIYQYISREADGVPYYARRLHGIIQNPVLKGQNPQKVLVEYE